MRNNTGHIFNPFLCKLNNNILIQKNFKMQVTWLDQCDMMKALGYNKHTLIKNKLRHVNIYKPISQERLKKENNELYNKIVV